MRHVDLGWMRVFVEVGRLGSLSQAARALNLTQPAISYQIRRAEAEFATPLLLRQHRGVALTQAGMQLHDILSRNIAQIDALARQLRDQDRQVLRLFTDYAFSALWLIPRIDAFRDTTPQAEVQIIAAQRTDPGQLGPDDSAVVFGARGDFAPDAVLLQPETVMPVCAPGHVPPSFAQARLIHLDSPQPARWLDWPHYLRATGQPKGPAEDPPHDPPPPRRLAPDPGPGALRFNTYSLVIEAALAGQGTALGWRGLIDAHLARGTLVPAGPQITQADRGYFMLGHPARSPAAARLQDWVQAQWAKAGA